MQENILISFSKRLSEIIKVRKIQNFFVFLFAIIIIWIFGRNISLISTVSALPDEAGYLGNAAYFAGYDWSEVLSSSNAYYAYGYSVFLIPVFWIAKTGVQVIQGACIVNIICVLGIYFLQIHVLKIIYGCQNKMILAAISFVTCLYPYIAASVLQTGCEIFLTFWYLLCGTLLYYAVKLNKVWMYGLLAIACSYLFFIHTRAFVAIGALFCTLLIIFFKSEKRKSIKNILVLMGIFLVAFVCFYRVKSLVLNIYTSGSIVVSQEATTANIITFDYIKERLEWLFTFQNIERFLLSFLAKIFYIGMGTYAMGIFGYIRLVKIAWQGVKNANDKTSSIAAYAMQVYFLLGITFMVFIQNISVRGMSSDFTYFFYGRYYEFMITPIILIGLYSCFYEKQSPQKIIYIIFISICTGIATTQLNKYFDNNEIHMDSGRIAAFTAVVGKNNNYIDMILYATLILVLFLSIYLIIHDKRWSKIFILFVVLTGIWSSSRKCIDILMQGHINSVDDAKIATYIQNNRNDEFIYVIEEPYRYPGFYARMQVLIKDEPIHILFPEQIDDIEKNAYILTYKDSKKGQELDDYKIMDGSCFSLYRVEIK